MSGTRTHFNALIGPGNPVSNITTTQIKCYPADAAPQTVTSAAISNTFGNWVEFIAADAVTADFTILGFTLRTDDDNFGGRLEIGVGAAASEVTIASTPLLLTYGLGRFYLTRPLMFCPKITANSRVAVRVGGGSAENYEIKLVYTQNLRVGGQFMDDYISETSYFSSKVYGGASWTYGAWKQVVAKSSLSGDLYLRGVYAQMYEDYELTVAVGVGDSGLEEVIAEIPFTGVVNAATLLYFPLSVMHQIDSLARVAVRIAPRAAGQDAYIGIDLAKGLLIS